MYYHRDHHYNEGSLLIGGILSANTETFRIITQSNQFDYVINTSDEDNCIENISSIQQEHHEIKPKHPRNDKGMALNLSTKMNQNQSKSKNNDNHSHSDQHHHRMNDNQLPNNKEHHSNSTSNSNRNNSDINLFRHFLMESFAGTFAGAAGVITGQPLDTIRLRIQTAKHGQSQLNTLQHLKQMIQYEGYRSLYKGMLSPLIGESINNMILFAVYQGLLPSILSQQKEKHDDNAFEQFLSGSIAGICICGVVTPSELIKIRLQINRDHYANRHTVGSRGFLDCGQFIYRNEGGILRGLYHGFFATFIREIFFNGIFFVSYEQTKKLLTDQVSKYLNRSRNSMNENKNTNNELNISTLPSSGYYWPIILCSGAVSGISSWAICYPLDIVKSIVQGRSPLIYSSTQLNYASVWREAWQRRILFQGIWPTVVRAVPSNAMTFLTYEVVSRFLHKSNT